MSLKIIENGTIRKLGYGFLFDFRSNWPYFASFTRYSDWSKIVIFSYPLHLTPLLGVPRHNIAKPFGAQKTRMVWLPDGEKVLKISLIFTQYTNMTDTQTDTARQHRPRLCNASRGKNVTILDPSRQCECVSF